MTTLPFRNIMEQRREKNGIVYFDRGIIVGNDGCRYDRLAIQTHFVELGENPIALVEKYVRPLWRQGDMLAFGAKVMCMCIRSVKTRDQIKPGFWAKLLWHFTNINPTGMGAHEPYKLQLIIDICGLPRVLFAAVLSALTKFFGIRGVFWRVCGHGVSGIDGFYPYSSFEIYKNLALINPENPDELCEDLFRKTGIPVALLDANDIDIHQLGKNRTFPLTDAQIQDALADNPSGQADELTPFILIRPL